MLTYQRLIALLLLTIPALIAAFGWKIMREVYIDYAAYEQFQLISFLGGLLLFLLGVGFIGGWILHRDRKRNLVQPRFMERDEDEE